MIEYEINERIAQSAKELNSFDDYKANSATNEYKSYLNEFEKDVNDLMAKHPENLNEEARQLIEYYKDRYAKKLAFAINKQNSIEAMCPSVLISGPANFPVRKKEKQNRARENFWNEYGKLFSEDNYYYNKIRNIILNKVVYSDDAMAIEKLEAKIDSLTELQNKMKEVNAYYKKHKTLEGCEILTKEEMIDRLRTMEMFTYYGQPYPSFELTNNNQNIHRLKERLDNLKKLKERANNETQQKYEQVDGVEISEDATDMRIRLKFNDIPDAETRTLLKHWGFKWSPSNSAWQRQLTTNGIWATKKVIEQLKEMKK